MSKKINKSFLFTLVILFCIEGNSWGSNKKATPIKIAPNQLASFINRLAKFFITNEEYSDHETNLTVIRQFNSQSHEIFSRILEQERIRAVEQERNRLSGVNMLGYNYILAPVITEDDVQYVNNAYNKISEIK